MSRPSNSPPKSSEKPAKSSIRILVVNDEQRARGSRRACGSRPEPLALRRVGGSIVAVTTLAAVGFGAGARWNRDKPASRVQPVETRTRLRPAAFAAYIASSALRISSTTLSLPPPAMVTIPMLSVMKGGAPSAGS